MDVDHLDLVLMLHGESRHCGDCGTATIFLPVGEQGWVCTACDAAVVLADAAHSWVSAA
jgi:ribosomal protein S27AE